MKIHAIQTGSGTIKQSQAVGRGRGLRPQLATFSDSTRTDGLPTYT